MKKFKKLMFVILIVFTLFVVGCKSTQPEKPSDQPSDQPGEQPGDQPGENPQEPDTPAKVEAPEEAKVSVQLEYESETERLYAEQFRVYNYKDGYKLLKTVVDGRFFFVVPEGKSAPSDLKADVTVVQLPVQNLLISSTPTTSLINALGDLSKIKLTTTALSTWQIPAVKEAMNNNQLTYIGDYKTPDYEVLEAKKPTISVFSTMLDSVPDVKTKLDDLSIPYMLDYASNENHPLARVEYVKLYGALIGTAESEINRVFNAQVEYVNNISATATGKTCAIFYVASSGLYVRNAGDYVTKMLTLAGGTYAGGDFNSSKTGNTKMTFEDFYAAQKDADFIIYIWSMGGKPADMEAFAAKNELLKDFKAYKEGNVWCTTPDFFQIADTLGYMISDINAMLNSTSETPDLTYLFRLQPKKAE